MGNIAAGFGQLLSQTAISMSRISSYFHTGKALHSAHFARHHELSELLAAAVDNEPSLLLAESRFNQILRVRPTRTRRELGNMLICAPTRGGKGLLAVSQLLSWKHSVVVNDIKGELYNQTAGFRATLGPVFVIDPQGVGHRYDPLSGKQTEDELYSIATQLLFRPNEADGAIFTQRAILMLTQLFLAAREEETPPLPYVREIIQNGLSQTAKRLHSLNPKLATRFLDVALNEASFSDRFLLSAWGTLLARIHPLLTENVIRSLSGTDFAPQTLMTSPQPVSIYLRWPEKDLLALSPLVRLLWGSLIDSLITTYDTLDGKDCRPVLLLIDEAGRTAIPSLADHATTVVGRGISLWVAVQSLSQLDAVYGRIRAQVLRDNMETQIYYRPSSHQTSLHLEHTLGRRSEYAHSHTEREGTQVSEGRTEQAVPLLTAQEIQQLHDHQIIGFHRRLPPFRGRRMDWRRFPTLTQRRAVPAPALSTLAPIEPLILEPKEIPPSAYFDPNELEKETSLLA